MATDTFAGVGAALLAVAAVALFLQQYFMFRACKCRESECEKKLHKHRVRGRWDGLLRQIEIRKHARHMSRLAASVAAELATVRKIEADIRDLRNEVACLQSALAVPHETHIKVRDKRSHDEEERVTKRPVCLTTSASSSSPPASHSRVKPRRKAPRHARDPPRDYSDGSMAEATPLSVRETRGESSAVAAQAPDRTNGRRDQGPGVFEASPSVPSAAPGEGRESWKSMTSIKPRTKQSSGRGFARSYSNDHIADHTYASSDHNSSVNTSKSYSCADVRQRLARNQCKAGASKVKPIAVSSGSRFYCNVVETAIAHFKRALPPRPVSPSEALTILESQAAEHHDSTPTASYCSDSKPGPWQVGSRKERATY
jgi:hypothetical protein